MERGLSNLVASTSGRPVAAASRRMSSRRPGRFQVFATSLDDMAEKQAALQKRKSATYDKDLADLTKQMPDPKEDPLFDNSSTKAWVDDDMDQQWAAAAAPGWEGSDAGGALGIGNALQSLPMGESEEAEAAELDADGLPSYRASSRTSKTYGAPSMPPPNAMPVRNIEDMTPEEAALEEYLMQEAVDAGMWLHHERLEKAHSKYSVSIRFGQILEDVESEDVRRGAAPVVPGTGLKMPSWIRASEDILPQLDALNKATEKAEIEANEAELARVRDSIIAEVTAAQELLAVTDPFAGVSLEDPTAAPEALDELFGDVETMLPGARSDMFASDLLDEVMGEEALQRALDKDGPANILQSTYQNMMKDVEKQLEGRGIDVDDELEVGVVRRESEEEEEEEEEEIVAVDEEEEIEEEFINTDDESAELIS